MPSFAQRRIYIPPRTLSLSGVYAQGQEDPMGMCRGGSALTFQVCTPTGTDPTGGQCSPNGISPEFGYCRPVGDGAVEGCRSGGIHF